MYIIYKLPYTIYYYIIIDIVNSLYYYYYKYSTQVTLQGIQCQDSIYKQARLTFQDNSVKLLTYNYCRVRTPYYAALDNSRVSSYNYAFNCLNNIKGSSSKALISTLNIAGLAS